ncbi:unnamed protein product [Diabrotica balteata]|uniref:EF-hand domain-containing protein n=1 Tax=Diabrotica balteata TaxID=107213 RepID=A0A9N9SKG9_DIABA|nr:unnamed protein product [Diabrotica balteata]
MSVEINITNGFPPDIITQFKEAFAFFDKHQTGEISTSQLGTIMRALGQNPTEKELKKITAEVDKQEFGTISFDTFINMMKCKLCTTNMVEELRESFQVLDRKSTGVISIFDLRDILTSTGDKFDDDEIEEMMKDVVLNDNDEVVYDEYINTLASK